MYTPLMLAANDSINYLRNGMYGRQGLNTTSGTFQLASNLPVQPYRLSGGGYESEFAREVGNKHYELKDHLGNVRVVVKDIKTAFDSDNDGNDDSYTASILSFNDYFPFGMQMPGRQYNSDSYTYGFGGHEKLDEVQGSGNIVDMGDRWLDVRLGRTSKTDVKAAKYPDLSPYSYAANNPLIFVDPDGKEIKIAKGLKKQQVMEILGTLQQLTNDKLVYKTLKDGSIQVKVASLAESGTETKVAGTRLIRRLNSSDNTLTIDYKNSLGNFSDGKGNKARASDYTKAADGTGSDGVVSFDPDSDPSIMTEDPKTGRVSGEKRPNKIGLGHELIHGEHYLDGDYSPSSEKASHTYKDASGKKKTQTYKKEELRTVGLAGTKDDDITENQLRKENGEKKRGAY